MTDKSSLVKQSFMHKIHQLCHFFGEGSSNDVLISHTITYLNDRDWHLRAAFFQHVAVIAGSVGQQSVDNYILPLMIQALSGSYYCLTLLDMEDTVVAQVLTALSSLAKMKLLQKVRVWECLDISVGLLCHPSIWIRHGMLYCLCASFCPTD